MLVATLGLTSITVKQADAQDGSDASPERVTHATDWHWRGTAPEGGAVAVEIVRGDIRIERASGREITVVVRRSARHADPAAVTLAVDTTAGVLRVRDIRQPAPRYGAREECLPPDLDGRGDFAHDDIHVRLIVRVPHGVRVATHVMDGHVVDATAAATRSR